MPRVRSSSRVTSRGWSKRPRPISLLALLGFVLGVAALLAAAFSGLGAQWGWWHFRAGFQILRWAAYGGIAAVVISLLGAAHAWPTFGRRGFSLALIGMVLGAVTVGVPWYWQRTARSVPPIHDITTDTQNPPQFSAILPLRADAPNPPEYAGGEVAARQREAYPDIQPLRLAESPETAFARALNAARSLGWEVVDADAEAGRIEATDRTFWFGFADDVVIRVTPAGEGARVDVRSKSRVGGSDVGANARRIRRFMTRLQEL
jgi:uncharacterized protein (DUF1499 family)